MGVCYEEVPAKILLVATLMHSVLGGCSKYSTPKFNWYFSK